MCKPFRRGKGGRSGLSVGTALMAAVLSSCGPELTDPSSVDISGQWRSHSNVGVVTEIQFDVVQAPNGALAGRWVGKTSAADAACPAEIGLNPTNILYGTNTLLQIEFELLGVGHFHGQVVGANRLEGSLLSCNIHYPVEFLLIEPALSLVAVWSGVR